MHCNKCGSNLNEGDKFCSNCGNSLASLNIKEKILLFKKELFKSRYWIFYIVSFAIMFVFNLLLSYCLLSKNYDKSIFVLGFPLSIISFIVAGKDKDKSRFFKVLCIIFSILFYLYCTLMFMYMVFSFVNVFENWNS